MWIPLSTQRTQYKPPPFGRSRRVNRTPPKRLHLIVAVRLTRKLPRVRIVPVRRYRRIVDHDALQVEAAISKVQNHVDGIFVLEPGGCAAQDFTFAEGRDLRDEHLEACCFEIAPYAVDGGVELNGAHDGHGLARGEVALQGSQQVRSVDADVDEDIERLDFGHVDGDETTVRIVYQQIAPQGSSRVIVYAACAVGDIPHDEGLDARTKLRENVRDGGGEEQEAFGHLEGHLLGSRGSNPVDGLGDFKAVVGREQGNGFLEIWVIEDILGDSVQKTGCSSWLGGW